MLESEYVWYAYATYVLHKLNMWCAKPYEPKDFFSVWTIFAGTLGDMVFLHEIAQLEKIYIRRQIEPDLRALLRFGIRNTRCGYFCGCQIYPAQPSEFRRPM